VRVTGVLELWRRSTERMVSSVATWPLVDGDGANRLRDRLAIIGGKLDRLRRDGWKKYRHHFRVEAHRFRPGSRLSEHELQAFEREHEISLPEDYRAFLLQIGEAAAGPYYGLLPLQRWADLAEEMPGHLSRPSPLIPEITYGEGWDEALGIAANPYCGLLPIVEQGCGGYSALTVTGAARGRVVSVGDGVPFFVRDRSFLDWYERWLEELDRR
jgi:hypothetical protein